MIPKRLLMAVATQRLIAEMPDGSFLWWFDSGRLDTTGPHADWVKRGLTAHSVTWDGPSIQEFPLSACLLRSFRPDPVAV
jgi:hypothetical protein